MWYSLTSLVANRQSLSGKKEKLVRFAKYYRDKYGIIGFEYGDDIKGLELNSDPEELYVSSFHVNDFLEAFKLIKGNYITIDRLKKTEESIGWPSSVSEIDPDDRITKTNEFDTDVEKTKLFHELVNLNARRKEILKELNK